MTELDLVSCSIISGTVTDENCDTASFRSCSSTPCASGGGKGTSCCSQYQMENRYSDSKEGESALWSAEEVDSIWISTIVIIIVQYKVRVNTL